MRTLFLLIYLWSISVAEYEILKFVESVQPTLSEFLIKENISNDIYLKLKEIGMDDINLYINISDDHLNDLCNDDELKLSIVDKIKLRKAIKRLQQIYSPKEKHFIQQIRTLTEKQQIEINKIKSAIKKSIDIQQIIESHFEEITENADNVKKTINERFNGIYKALQQRQDALYQQVDIWEYKNLQNINKLMINMNGYQNELNNILSRCNQILTTDESSKIEHIMHEFWKNSNNETFMEIDDVLSKEMMNVKFMQNVKLNELNLFGRLHINKVKNVKETIVENKDESKWNIVPIIIEVMIILFLVKKMFICIASPFMFPLTIHSHNGHFQDFKPKNILNSNDLKYYLSKKHVIFGDWIIFSIKDDFIKYRYFPIKVSIRTSNTDLSVKQFVLFIGSTLRNEWIQLHQQAFIAKKTFEIQVFQLNFSDKGFNKIWKRNYHQFKLQMIDNYGSNAMLITEFKIFGYFWPCKFS